MALAVGVEIPLAAQSDPVFDGVWEGSVDVVATYGMKKRPDWLSRDQYPLRIQVRGNTVSVRHDKRQLRPEGGFRIERHGAAALVYSDVASDWWIETWQISLTKTDANTVLVFLWRVVNNKFRRLDEDRSKFAWAGVGELKRVPSTRRDSN